MKETLPKRIAVTGSAGRLGRALGRALRSEGCEVIELNRANFPMEHPEAAEQILSGLEFDALINPAAVTAVDYCEDHQEEARDVNDVTPAKMAALCAQRGAKFIHVSTDYVFDGEESGLRTEEDPAVPQGVYAETKRAGEISVLRENPAAVVTRVSWVFGPDRPSFPDSLLQKALAGEELKAVADKWACPTYAPDAAEWILALLRQSDAQGIFHLCNSGLTTWREYAEETIAIAADMGLPVKSTTVGGVTRAEISAFIAPRPAHTGMDTSRFSRLTGIVPRPWQEAMRDHIRAVHFA